jgi:hypothetical protein
MNMRRLLLWQFASGLFRALHYSIRRVQFFGPITSVAGQISVRQQLIRFPQTVSQLPWCDTQHSGDISTTFFYLSFVFAFSTDHVFQHKHSGLKGQLHFHSTCMRLNSWPSTADLTGRGNAIKWRKRGHNSIFTALACAWTVDRLRRIWLAGAMQSSDANVAACVKLLDRFPLPVLLAFACTQWSESPCRLLICIPHRNEQRRFEAYEHPIVIQHIIMFWIWGSHAVTVKNIVFWVVTPCNSERILRFGGICHLHLQDLRLN